MFSDLYQKELKQMLYSRQFLISFIILAFLVLISFVVGIQNYTNAKTQYEAALSEHQSQLSQARYWQMVNHKVFLPPNPLSVLVSGLANDVGRKVDLRTSGDLIAQDSRYGDNTILAVFRSFDLEFMFSVVLTLFAIVFTYNAVNGEREQGTLSLLFSNSVPRTTFILAKLTGILTALIAPLLVVLLAGLLLLPLFGIQLSVDDWIRLGLIILAGLLHFSFFVLIGIGISSVVRSSSASFLTLLVFWIFSVFIVPRAAVLIAGRAIEVPNTDEITAQKTRYRTQLFAEDRPKMAGFKPSQTGDMQAVMVEFQKMMAELGEERAKKVAVLSQKLDENLSNKEQLRDQVASMLAQLSPSAAYSFTVADLAQSGLLLPKRFLQTAKDYKQVFDGFITSKTGSKNNGMIMVFETDDDERPSINVSEIPVYTIEKPSLSQTLDSVAFGFSILVFFNISGLLIAIIGFIKADLI
jgi:ABC-type transport system involved in multi-copper enzyme maturation permease subunit